MQKKPITTAIRSLLVFFWVAFIPSASSADYNDYDNIPCIIYLKGSTCAGKSTLIKSINQRWEDLEIVDGDSIVMRTYPEAVAERFPFEYEMVAKAIANENLYHALRAGDILFKTEASEEECRRAELAISAIQAELDQSENLPWRLAVAETIRQEILDLTKQALNRGKNVLLDTWYFNADEIQESFPELATIRVMLYCPFEIAYERLLKRNNEATANCNLLEKRYMAQLMRSFCSLYKVSDQPNQLLQRINKHDLEQIFAMISQDLDEGDPEKPQPVFSIEEITQSKFQKLQREFMEPFEKFQCDNLYITPVEQQDLIIDNTFGNVYNSLNTLDLVMSFGKDWKDIQTLEAMNEEVPEPATPTPRTQRSVKFFPGFCF